MDFLYSLLCGLILSITTSIIGYWIGKVRNTTKEADAIKHGLQAILRDRMVSLYHEAHQISYTTIEEKSNFDNLYNCYHSLGANGVMDEIHSEYMNMEVRQ